MRGGSNASTITSLEITQVYLRSSECGGPNETELVLAPTIEVVSFTEDQKNFVIPQSKEGDNTPVQVGAWSKWLAGGCVIGEGVRPQPEAMPGGGSTLSLTIPTSFEVVEGHRFYGGGEPEPPNEYSFKPGEPIELFGPATFYDLSSAEALSGRNLVIVVTVRLSDESCDSYFLDVGELPYSELTPEVTANIRSVQKDEIDSICR